MTTSRNGMNSDVAK